MASGCNQLVYRTGWKEVTIPLGFGDVSIVDKSFIV